jgi:hypothetical protein
MSNRRRTVLRPLSAWLVDVLEMLQLPSDNETSVSLIPKKTFSLAERYVPSSHKPGKVE